MLKTRKFRVLASYQPGWPQSGSAATTRGLCSRPPALRQPNSLAQPSTVLFLCVPSRSSVRGDVTMVVSSHRSTAAEGLTAVEARAGRGGGCSALYNTC